MALLAYENYPEMDALCNEVLTLIESQELRLLNWGFVDLKTDLDAQLPMLLAQLPPYGRQLWEQARQYSVTPQIIVDNLKSRRLVFAQYLNGRTFYRSRFAEAIRLLVLLRQRFSYQDWQTGLRLVNDIKVDIKRRMYPKRDIVESELCDELHNLGASSLYIQAVQCLLQKPDGSYLTLARFQKDAVLHHYRMLHHGNDIFTRSDQALVIGAGTGSGKTKAFYIPAMAEIADTMTPDAYLKALAIYPRIELLKDQLGEAFLEARKLDDFLTQKQRRTITIGAYYGDTPVSAKFLLDAEWTTWAKAPEKRGVDGWECPFFTCPSATCEHDPQPLIWYREDVEKEARENEQNRFGTYARLRCPHCLLVVHSHQLLFTRQQLTRTPPDILFTTTEMLNRRMSRTGEHELFGIDIAHKPLPRMLLLDEIHTYEGLSGAHVAYLLRRWRYARRLHKQDALCCVGLSATLNNAEAFFAKLTGIPTSFVNYVHPERADMDEEGAEYNVVIKGDPVSATTLLSTSVQTIMLLARMLDVNQNDPSHGAFGQKIFAFTDKLDVINRWYYIQHDAELIQTLSQYRQLRPTDRQDLKQKKAQAGQTWLACEQIGHDLRKPLRIGLTSSQHRGVRANADAVIATSTLEVGYNDPTVGVVIQHKAPYSMASFLQRKGRAGRSRKMRPWMVVVTSAYGRDRWAFQHAEQLFNPTLNDIHLPIENYYVRKIQATFAFMDWLSLEMKRTLRSVDLWDCFSSHEGKRAEYLQNQRKIIQDVLENILSGKGGQREKLQRYLQQALGLRNRRELDALFWDEPRSLMFEVFPTLLRQLESNWQRISYDENRSRWNAESWADGIARTPMPGFVTPNLFSNLKSIDIPIQLPPEPVQANVKFKAKSANALRPELQEQTLPLLQCMVEFAPGHVNKRFIRHEVASERAQKVKNESHWLALPEDTYLSHDQLPIDKLDLVYDGTPGKWHIQGKDYVLYRPRAYRLAHVPAQVKDSSTGYLVWQSHFSGKSAIQTATQTSSSGKTLTLAKNSPWSQMIAAIQGYTQDTGCWAEVVRLATGVQVETRFAGRKESRRRWLQFTHGRHAAAIGFISQVDALQFHMHPLDVEHLMHSPAWPDLLIHLRPEYFRYRLRTHARVIKARLSHFEVDWLWQLELSMLVATAVARSCSLPQAAEEVRATRLSLSKRTMEVIFQSQQIDAEENEKSGRLQERLQELISNPDVMQALDSCVPVLWGEPDQAFALWLRHCYASSLGHALFATLTRLIPDMNADDLVMDVDGNSVWISEATPGGIGIISQLITLFETAPHEFDLQMKDVLRYCERQEIVTQLQMVADHIREGDQELQQAFRVIRQATDLISQEAILEQLKSLLEQRGIPATRDLVVALHAKFLRANTGPDTDQLIAHLSDFWRAEERRLGCAIDLRIIAVAARKRPALDQRITATLRRINDEEQAPDSQIFNVLQSLLWLPCVNSCPDCIEHPSLYQDLVKPSRLLLLSLLPSVGKTIAYGQDAWKACVQDELVHRYVVTLTCAQDQLAQCKHDLQVLLVEHIEIGFQYFYPIIESISRTGQSWDIELRIREFAHG
jgi:hypothetical protein